MAGWICLHRDIQDHWLFNFDEPDKALAWIDLILSANHEDNKFMIKGRAVECKRGQVAMSQLTLQKRWKMSQNKLKRFLVLLKNDGMIDFETNDLTTLITICNYSSFQDGERPNERPDERPDERTTDDQSNDKQQCKQLQQKEVVVVVGREEKPKPQHPEMKWVEYFVNEKGFQIHEAQTATTIPMFLHWESVGVSIPDVELAMIVANRKLNGERPSFPTYYRNFVQNVMDEKQKSQKIPGQGIASGFNSNNNGNHYVTNQNRNEISSVTGRKLSIVEQAAASTARVEARDLWEQQQRESVVN